MFNLGGPEIVVIILVALVVLGPEQLPKAMRTFGNVMGEVRKLSSGFQSEMRDAMNAAESSSSQGTATSSGANGSANGSSSTDGVEEVVVRNDGSASGSEPPALEPGPTSPTSPSGPDRSVGRPPIDSDGPSAADRAAG